MNSKFSPFNKKRLEREGSTSNIYLFSRHNPHLEIIKCQKRESISYNTCGLNKPCPWVYSCSSVQRAQVCVRAWVCVCVCLRKRPGSSDLIPGIINIQGLGVRKHFKTDSWILSVMFPPSGIHSMPQYMHYRETLITKICIIIKGLYAGCCTKLFAHLVFFNPHDNFKR